MSKIVHAVVTLSLISLSYAVSLWIPFEPNVPLVARLVMGCIVAVGCVLAVFTFALLVSLTSMVVIRVVEDVRASVSKRRHMKGAAANEREFMRNAKANRPDGLPPNVLILDANDTSRLSTGWRHCRNGEAQ